VRDPTKPDAGDIAIDVLRDFYLRHRNDHELIREVLRHPVWIELNDRDAENAILEAREGNLTRLMGRLRDSHDLTKRERQFLADLIEGKTKPRKPRPPKSGKILTLSERRRIVWAVLSAQGLRKQVIDDMCRRYGVSERYVFNLLKPSAENLELYEAVWNRTVEPR
jgi:hypothetical protein